MPDYGTSLLSRALAAPLHTYVGRERVCISVCSVTLTRRLSHGTRAIRHHRVAWTAVPTHTDHHHAAARVRLAAVSAREPRARARPELAQPNGAVFNLSGSSGPGRGSLVPRQAAPDAGRQK